MVKETRKLTEKGKFSHMLCPFPATPITGMLAVSWHWQGGINPQQDPLLGADFCYYEAW